MKIKAVEKELLEPGWRKACRPQKKRVYQPGKGRWLGWRSGSACARKSPRQIRSGLDEAGLIRALREKGIGRPAVGLR